MKNQKILVTGFKPFLNEPINPSELLVKSLAAKRNDIETLILPVTYDGSFKALESQWKEKTYKAILMLGQAGGRNSVCLERVALNWTESSHPDESGHKPTPGHLIADAPASYIVDFFPAAWKEELEKIAPTSISHSAGTYVCNSLYYNVIHSITKKHTPALFVHVPYLPEQVTEKPNAPSMDLAAQELVINKIIELLSSLK